MELQPDRICEEVAYRKTQNFLGHCSSRGKRGVFWDKIDSEGGIYDHSHCKFFFMATSFLNLFPSCVATEEWIADGGNFVGGITTPSLNINSEEI